MAQCEENTCKSDFESDMDDELDRSLGQFANSMMQTPTTPQDTEMPSLQASNEATVLVIFLSTR